jgi:hypothetical protein
MTSVPMVPGATGPRGPTVVVPKRKPQIHDPNGR